MIHAKEYATSFFVYKNGINENIFAFMVIARAKGRILNSMKGRIFDLFTNVQELYSICEIRIQNILFKNGMERTKSEHSKTH